MMSGEETDHIHQVALLIFFILVTGRVVAGNSLETDKEVLLKLRSFLEGQNRINRGIYTEWNPQDSSPCNWSGISCDVNGTRVTGVHLSNNNIAGLIFPNFSDLTSLTHLDLSKNTLEGVIPADLGRCRNLKALNLSHNIVGGELNLTGLNSLEILDLSLNRLRGDIQLIFPGTCNSLVVVNISANNFTGELRSSFDHCQNLKHLDLSTNNLSGNIPFGFERLKEFSVSENYLFGIVPAWTFTENCSLQALDLSENFLSGEFPKEISNCKNLAMLNLWGNNFSGPIPQEIGSISSLQALYLGNNSFSRDIPESLLGLSKLTFLDLSRNNFGGEIQEIFGRFAQLKFLVLHSNAYTGGLHSSGILKLQNISRLDLSYNRFSGPLPIDISLMLSLKFLILAYNQFTGTIPPEYGNVLGLQALDLSFNGLNGSIPSSFGNLKSLLWLMLANNSLTGEIPPELGNCSSLLWLNLANNRLSGSIPPKLTNIGMNASPTFLSNRNGQISVGSGECLLMRRWIPADYPPFSFVYTLLTRKSCRSLWDRLLKGYGLFPVCLPGTNIRTFQVSGYVQLSGNQLSGELPHEIGKMQNVSMLHLGLNEFYGTLPLEIQLMPLAVLNISQNKFSGAIPMEIGNIKCLQNLDLSYNNFSFAFPTSLSNLTDLTKFNISYNPYISGTIPTTGQLVTFEKWSFLGDPLLHLPAFIDNTASNSTTNNKGKTKRPANVGASLVFIALLQAFLVCGVMTLIVCLVVKSPADIPGYFFGETKGQDDLVSSSSTSSSDTIKVICLEKTMFTHVDILKATGNFSEDRIIGRGGSGTVYRGLLPNGRQIAVKKLQREGVEGEKEFQAEMEVLSGNGFGWPHPNLVTLYGWCLEGREKLLVYEYMQGGSLEELISDRTRLTWKQRIDVAIDIARALVFLHHECSPAIVHRDIKASNVLLDKNGKAHVTDFGLARVVIAGDSHVSTVVAGTVGYVAPEYGQTWQATTKGDVYSYGVLVMELATGRRAVDGEEECLVEWTRRIIRDGRQGFSGATTLHMSLLVYGLAEGAEEMCELLGIGIRCTTEAPQCRPNMKEVLAMLIRISLQSKGF
ncbi:unnamed protein product [Ilex paraguariensis]|uniref:non-specific serine/threonine protein kinase n=1 Tax=Ilex paraguariensis TaxID=185542 RepID=A0ABC8T2B4_9AQUA